MLVRMSIKAVIVYDCNRNDPKLAREVSLKRVTDDLERFACNGDVKSGKGSLESIRVDMLLSRTVRLLANGKYADVTCSVDDGGNNVVTDAMLAMVGIDNVSAYNRRDSADKHFVEFNVIA